MLSAKEVKPLLNELNRKLQYFFGHDLSFDQYSLQYILRSSGETSQTITNNSEVVANKLFDKYWVYCMLKFEPMENKKANNVNVFFSLILFYGEYDSLSKQHILRAEWDNYKNTCAKHPQPHWHFYMNNNTLEQMDFFKPQDISEDANNFMSSIGPTQLSHKAFEQMHFAMREEWSDGENHIHTAKDKDKLISWVQGLLKHLNDQLKYIDGKTCTND